jgi:NAD(P)-dependent dehydrogenase (short-subunit alcohol dehydrogenase family)
MRYKYERALIVGVGDGLSAAVARRLAADGLKVGLSARSSAKVESLGRELGAAVHLGDASVPEEVDRLFAAMSDALGGAPDVVIYNPSARVRGPLVDLDRAAVANALQVTAYGAFLVAQAAARPMLAAGRGAILFTGASAGLKGFPQSAAFAMGKFALRGLAESMARELGPNGIHVAHVVIDGGIQAAPEAESANAPDSMLSPDAIADTYAMLLHQDRSTWTNEIVVRPWIESF